MNITFFIDVVRNIAVIMVMAYVISQLKAFRQSLSYSSYHFTDKMVLTLFFGALSAIGNVLSIPVIGGALANHRIVGAVTGGLLGGPAVGLGAGIIGAVPRYFMGGFTMWAAVISNVAAGLISGLVYKYCGPKRFKMRIAFATALAAEAVLKLLVLAIAEPFDKAFELERIIALPTILTNCLGVCLFTYIVRDMLREKEKDQAKSANQAMRVILSTSGLLRNGLNHDTALRLAAIILQETKAAAVEVAGSEKMLAFVGQETELASVVEAPLIINNELLGSIRLYRAGNETVSPYAVELIQGIADFLSLQLAEYMLREQVVLLARAELNVLRAQINPHFLFNAMGTIRWMAGKDPEAARSLIKDLSDFLRRTLYRGEEIVSLQDELDAIGAYIRIEKARFGDKIKIMMEVPDQFLSCHVPVFTLQPLVENSIKHGLSPKKGPGAIHISAWEEGQDLYVEITDDGVGIATEKLAAILHVKQDGTGSGSGGIGIQNVHKRLQQIYGTKYGLMIKSRPGCTSVTVSFPRNLLQNSIMTR